LSKAAIFKTSAANRRQLFSTNTLPSNKFGIRVGCDLYILSIDGW
jgi:hypothetical protein